MVANRDILTPCGLENLHYNLLLNLLSPVGLVHAAGFCKLLVITDVLYNTSAAINPKDMLRRGTQEAEGVGLLNR